MEKPMIHITLQRKLHSRLQWIWQIQVMELSVWMSLPSWSSRPSWSALDAGRMPGLGKGLLSPGNRKHRWFKPGVNKVVQHDCLGRWWTLLHLEGATLPSFESWGCLILIFIRETPEWVALYAWFCSSYFYFTCICAWFHGYTVYIHCQNKAHRPITACHYVGREELTLIPGALQQAGLRNHQTYLQSWRLWRKIPMGSQREWSSCYICAKTTWTQETQETVASDRRVWTLL